MEWLLRGEGRGSGSRKRAIKQRIRGREWEMQTGSAKGRFPKRNEEWMGSRK
jgi:hypothetical protein